jgi:hypothetical protein
VNNSDYIYECPLCKKPMKYKKDGSGNCTEYNMSCSCCEVVFVSYEYKKLFMFLESCDIRRRVK